MSTYVYLQCLDHNPPLRAEEESGQHLSDLPRIRAEVADRNTVAAEAHEYSSPDHWPDWRTDPEGSDAEMARYFRARSAIFLHQHSRCHIGIIDEYGREHALTEDGDPT